MFLHVIESRALADTHSHCSRIGRRGKFKSYNTPLPACYAPYLTILCACDRRVVILHHREHTVPVHQNRRQTSPSFYLAPGCLAVTRILSLTSL